MKDRRRERQSRQRSSPFAKRLAAIIVGPDVQAIERVEHDGRAFDAGVLERLKRRQAPAGSVEASVACIGSWGMSDTQTA
jgi:hypothetical protein